MLSITPSYFTGLINIPNVDKDIVAEALADFIVVYEKELLINLLGYPLYNAFKNGLSAQEPDAKWNELRTGATYTLNGKTQYWQGLKVVGSNNEPSTSIVAYYVYYWYTRNNQSLTTGIGEQVAKPEAGTNVSSARKQVLAWNNMVQWAFDLYQFLEAKQQVYTDWQNHYWIYCRTTNTFGI